MEYGLHPSSLTVVEQRSPRQSCVSKDVVLEGEKHVLVSQSQTEEATPQQFESEQAYDHFQLFDEDFISKQRAIQDEITEQQARSRFLNNLEILKKYNHNQTESPCSKKNGVSKEINIKNALASLDLTSRQSNKQTVTINVKRIKRVTFNQDNS